MNIPKAKCCGCGACANVCPTHCVSMREDEEGFAYPVTDAAKCVNCGLCEMVCAPVACKSQMTAGAVRQAFASVTLNAEVRRESSSGGVFYELASRVIQKGGCAFGVAMDEDCKGASFRKAETETELRKLMASKYIQASADTAYQEAERELKAGRAVLFTGAPCHVNALQLYLRRSNADAENLFCADVICHGAPSPKLWRAYANEFERARNAKLTSVSFRCKEETWRNLGLRLNAVNENRFAEKLLIPAEKDPYMKLFLANYSLRPSCYDCASKKFRLSDLTIGDFWGIENILPELDDAKGTSLVLIRTEKGQRMFDDIKGCARCAETAYQEAVQYNSSEYESVACPAKRSEFFKDANALTLEKLSEKYVRQSFYRRVRSALSSLWNKIPIREGRDAKTFRYALLMEFASEE